MEQRWLISSAKEAVCLSLCLSVCLVKAVLVPRLSFIAVSSNFSLREVAEIEI